MTTRIRVAGVEHLITPTGRRTLLQLLHHEQRPATVARPDPHPATRARLINQGLIRLDQHQQPVFTPVGREVAIRLEDQP